MYSCEQDHTAAARTTTFVAGRSLQMSAHHHPNQPEGLRTAARSAPVAAGALQIRRAKNKKHGALRPSSSSRRSTTVVATDVNNFRAMVQELTSIPPAAIFRPLPRRVHAANPFVAVNVATGQRCGGDGEQHGRYGGSEAIMVANSTAGGGGGGISPVGPSALPVAVMPQQPPGVFDGVLDIWSPESDSWADLSVE